MMGESNIGIQRGVTVANRQPPLARPFLCNVKISAIPGFGSHHRPGEPFSSLTPCFFVSFLSITNSVSAVFISFAFEKNLFRCGR
jgi:hypothetical protein